MRVEIKIKDINNGYICNIDSVLGTETLFFKTYKEATEYSVSVFNLIQKKLFN